MLKPLKDQMKEINEALNFRSEKQVENVFKAPKRLYHITSETGLKLNKKPFYATIEQVRVFAKLRYPIWKVSTIEVPPIDLNRINFLDNIDLDLLEFTTSLIDDEAYSCKYKERVLFDFYLAGDKAHLICEFNEISSSISIEDLKEFPDFIVLLDTI